MVALVQPAILEGAFLEGITLLGIVVIVTQSRWGVNVRKNGA